MQTWFKRAPVYAGLTFSLSLGLVACGGNKAPTPVTSPTVTSVTVSLNPTSAPVGGTSQANATVTGNNNPVKTVTWSVSTPTGTAPVATVDQNGKVTVAPTAQEGDKATVVATSTVDKTKSGTATLTVAAAVVTPAPNPGSDKQFSFRPAITSVALPDGYTASTGTPYNDTDKFGWVKAGTSTPLDFSTNARDRSKTTTGATYPARQQTFIITQCPPPADPNHCGEANGTPQTVAGAFEYAVPSGSYDVTVSVGDADTTQTSLAQTINVEGTSAIANFTPSAQSPFQEKTVTVAVTDGRLTVDSGSSVLTKINYLIVKSVAAPVTAP